MKHALTLLAAMLAVPLTLAAVPSATAAVDPKDPLPAIDGNHVMSPLTPGQLDPREREAFAKFAPGSDDARRFLYARGFLRYSRRVVERALDPGQLPALPDRKDWDSKFFSEAERKIVDDALGLKIRSKLKPDLPASAEMSPLSPGQLNPDERKAFAKLQSGSDDARRFLYTRSYLRYCERVIDGTLVPLELPKLPDKENWDRKFLTETEGKQVVDVALVMKMMAMMK